MQSRAPPDSTAPKRRVQKTLAAPGPSTSSLSRRVLQGTRLASPHQKVETRNRSLPTVAAFHSRVRLMTARRPSPRCPR